MSFVVQNALSAIALAVGMLAMIALGRRNGIRRVAADPVHARAGLGVIDASVFALLGLVLAFTFNGAGERFAARRAHMGDELQVIEGGWRKLDLLPAEEQPAMRTLFRRYVDERIAAYRAVPDRARVVAKIKAAMGTLEEIWTRSVAITATGTGVAARVHIVPAIDRMIEMNTKSWVLMIQHPPRIVYVVMAVLMLLTALFVGEGMAEASRPSVPHVVGLVVILSGLYFVIMDLENPMMGLIHLDTTLAALDDLRRSFGP